MEPGFALMRQAISWCHAAIQGADENEKSSTYSPISELYVIRACQ